MPLEIPVAAALRGGSTGLDTVAGEGAGGRIGFAIFAFGLFARPIICSARSLAGWLHLS